MSWGTPDVWYQPEEFGLTPVVKIDWTNEAYQFNYTGVWQDAHGQFYIGHDAGCSCPTPFEWATSLDELEKVSKFEAADALLKRCAAKEPDPAYGWSFANDQLNYERVQGEVVDAIAKIMKAGK